MFDLILLVLLALCVVRGYRAGFFMGIKNIVSVVVGFFVAAAGSQRFALFLTQNSSLPDSISAWLTEKLSGLTFQPAVPSTGFFSSLPEVLQEQMLHLFPSQPLLSASTDFVNWLTQLFIGCIAFIVLLVGTTLVIRVLAYILGKTMDAALPSYMLNHTAGAVLYGVQFCLLVMAVLYVTRPLLLTGSSMNVAWLVSLQQAVEQSFIVQILENILKALGWM